MNLKALGMDLPIKKPTLHQAEKLEADSMHIAYYHQLIVRP
jgi:hypothetical protein